MFINQDDYTPLHFAALANSLLITKVLIKHGANPNAIATFREEKTCLDYCIENGMTEIADILREYGGFESKREPETKVRPVDLADDKELVEYLKQL